MMLLWLLIRAFLSTPNPVPHTHAPPNLSLPYFPFRPSHDTRRSSTAT